MNLQQITESILEQMKLAGFEQSRVELKHTEKDELCITHDKADLLRSCENIHLLLIGIVDQRKASALITQLDENSITTAIKELLSEAQSAPIDKANQVSFGQVSTLTKGPQEADLNILTVAAKALLAFRATETPNMHLEEACVEYVKEKSLLITSEGTQLNASIGYYGMSVFGTAKEGPNTSSFNYAWGRCDNLNLKATEKHFAIDETLIETSSQVISQPLTENFEGEVLLTANAVADLLAWLLIQVGSMGLLKGTSIYQDKVGHNIASPLLTIKSHDDSSGASPFSEDGFILSPVTLIQNGQLQCLLPTLYASRQLDIAHVPQNGAWSILPGKTNKADMLKSIKQGALVGRLSMGYPASNGDFSGVIKNSFLIKNGEKKHALSEVMISGNIAKMLQEISAISSEVVDNGIYSFPCLQIPYLRFS